MTTVLMVSGSWPPQVCGVGDYTEVLSRELERRSVSVMRFGSDKFSNFYAPDIVGQIKGADCDLVHIQYPTAGYGRSLTPSVLAHSVRDKPVVATLHEYSLFRWYRRPWFSRFAQRCAARIFTTDEEHDLFERRFPNRRGADLTIEIASNIPVSSIVKRRPGRVCYFGLISPNKGLEEFLELCAAARQTASGLSFEVIGAVPERDHHYADEILKRATASGAQISLRLPDEAVAERLASAAYAYLPFPDGASPKRGSLAAAIVNGLIVVTRHSRITPEWIRAATLDTKTPHDALDALVKLQSHSHIRADMKSRTEQAAARFHWDAIAQRHVELYRQLLGQASDDDGHVATASITQQARHESRLAS